MTIEHLRIRPGDQDLDIEYVWLGADRQSAPTIVFLHEGLGSRAMWKDYPAQLCDALGWRGLVFSRPGYGRSLPGAAGEIWPVDYKQRQAYEVLPAFLSALPVERPWLFGHSDGASISLLYAAAFPQRVSAVVALAPHLFVEDLTVRSIALAKETYATSDMPERLGRYHDDPDAVFRRWNDIWLDPRFRAWNVEAEMRAIRCPVLAVQGEDDEYGTMTQIERLAELAPQVSLVRLPDCRHSAHRDQPELLTAAVLDFVRRVRPGLREGAAPGTSAGSTE